MVLTVMMFDNGC